MVITQTDYAKYQEKREMLWNRLKIDCATSTILYVGYSGYDNNWQAIIEEISREFAPTPMPDNACRLQDRPHSEGGTDGSLCMEKNSLPQVVTSGRIAGFRRSAAKSMMAGAALAKHQAVLAGLFAGQHVVVFTRHRTAARAE